MVPHQQHQLKDYVDNLNAALDSGTFLQVRRMLNGQLPTVDVAHLLESFPPKERDILWRLINQENRGDILSHLDDDIRSQFLNQMDAKSLVDSISELEIDNITDILQQLPEQVLSQVLLSMDLQHRKRIETALSYPEDTAGGLMNNDVVTVRSDLTVDAVLRYLRNYATIPTNTDSVVVVDYKNHALGSLSLSRLITNDSQALIKDLINTEIDVIPVNLSSTEVASLFERHNLLSAPVVDEENRVLGRITVDDVLDVIIEEADHSLLSMAGLNEDATTFDSVKTSTQRRSIWLGINLVTAILAASVVHIFDATIEKVVALAILMPIVASMGGIAGTQSLTLIIRAMALKQISASNTWWLLNRELIVGLLNGILWALVISGLAFLWFNDTTLTIVMFSSMVVSMLVACLAGAALPIILDKMGIDPAIAGGVLITTVTDVIGFLSLLGLATLLYF
jgi:magnesium transporter